MASLSVIKISSMNRFTISLDDDLAASFNQLVKQFGYVTRSEAVRDLLRERLQRRGETRNAHAYCVANLSYVYNYHERELAERLARIQHGHHDLVMATMHTVLDHNQRLETMMLRGLVKAVRQLANEIVAERGVRYGQLNLVDVEFDKPHSHGGVLHRHLKPRH